MRTKKQAIQKTSQEQPQEQNRPYHLFVGTPVYSDFVSRKYHESMLLLVDACLNSGVRLTLRTHDGTFIYENRDILTEQFYQSGADTLLWVDSDIVFTANDVNVLIQDLKLQPVEMVTGLYRRKQAVLGYDVQLLNEPAIHVDGGTLQQAASCGAGFLAMRRSVIEKLRATMGPCGTGPYPEARRLWEPVNNLTEDIAFCHRWRAIGGEIFLDARASVGHVGVFEYRPALTPATPPPVALSDKAPEPMTAKAPNERPARKKR